MSSRKQRAREWLFEQQGKRCYYCGRKMALPKPVKRFVMQPYHATLDHIIPQSQGGAFAPMTNCVAACHECNQERADTDARLFLLKKQGAL